MSEESKEEKLQRMIAQVTLDREAWENMPLPTRKIDGLTIADWLQITRIPIGKCGRYAVSSAGVFFTKWTDDEMEDFPDHRLKMAEENQHCLRFPCSERELIDFFQGDVCGSLAALPDEFCNSANAPLGEVEIKANEIIQMCRSSFPEPMAIPRGGRASIKRACLKMPDRFTESTFKTAWQRALDMKKIRTLDHDKHAKGKKNH